MSTEKNGKKDRANGPQFTPVSYRATLESLSPYSQSRYFTDGTPRPAFMGHGEYREQTWRLHMHVGDDGFVLIPSMAFKNGLVSAAKTRGDKLPGNKTFTKPFEQAVIVTGDLRTNVKGIDVQPEHLFLPSDGIRGSGKRVPKIYPLIPAWKGSVEILVIDNRITLQVLNDHLVTMGTMIGVGRFRPEKNGFYGRFRVLNLEKIDG